MPASEPTIKSFLQGFGGQWFTRMSGPLTVPFAIAALFVSTVWAKSLFAVLAILCAIVCAYAMWAKEREARVAAEASIATLEAKPSLDIGNEWKDLSARFEKLTDYARVDWQCNRKHNQTIYEAWQFSGSNTDQCETLCKYAGTLIVKSPHVVKHLSEMAKQQTDPVWRWLYFLKENHRALRYMDGHPPIGDDGTIYLLGSIDKVASISARVCLECSASEL